MILGKFLSTLSLRRATQRLQRGEPLKRKFLSTLSLRRATHKHTNKGVNNYISIHALLAESDRPRYSFDRRFAISIHALLAESDKLTFCAVISILNFYPRSPCGERPRRYRRWPAARPISIHALLAESDQCSHDAILPPYIFLSTLSLRRATYIIGHAVNFHPISIHALLAESDSPPSITPTASRNFYPRSPCGERPPSPPRREFYNNFYPRSPCGERHWPPVRDVIQWEDFYPRSPCGERLFSPRAFAPVCLISIHALLAESDRGPRLPPLPSA